MKILKTLFVVLALALAGCANPGTISNEPLANQIAAKVAPAGSGIAVGLQNSAYNLDQAIAIGILPADDQAAGCVHSALKLAGLEAAAGSDAVKSFVPKVSDALSAGSVLYIRDVQARNQKPFDVSVSCKAVVGDIALKGLAAGITTAESLVPGAGVLQAIKAKTGL